MFFLKMLNFEQLIRPNLRALLHVPPVDETLLPKAGALRLDTNANPYDLPFNHDVDRQALSLRRALASLKRTDVSNVFVCNSFAGVVDLCCRCFCVPGEDNVVAAGPTRAVYRQMAQLNGVEYREVALDEHFGLAVDEVLGSCDNHTKLIWLCSPNDPTGNLLDVNAIASLLDVYDGMVVVDETYLRFSKSPSWCSVLQRFPNLIVLEQMDAAWGINALNVGMLYASSDVVRLMLAVGESYALSPVIESKMCGVFSDAFEMDRLVGNVVAERTRMAHALAQLSFCEQVCPSFSNFLLVRFRNAPAVFEALFSRGIVVCRPADGLFQKGYLRITIGSKSANNALLSALRQF